MKLTARPRVVSTSALREIVKSAGQAATVKPGERPITASPTLARSIRLPACPGVVWASPRTVTLPEPANVAPAVTVAVPFAPPDPSTSIVAEEPPYRRRKVAPRRHPVLELVEVVRKINLEVCNRLCVYPSRSLVGLHMF
jgi:hypothetical protein